MSIVCVDRIIERSSGIGSRPNTSVKASKIMNTGMKAIAPSSFVTAFAPAHSQAPLDAFGIGLPVALRDVQRDRPWHCAKTP